jgi:putative FmdB family regulatory protein
VPLYEYECDDCGHRFEIIQKFSDPPSDACPKCGGRVRKLQSAPAFHLKGSGWYITDYAKKEQPAGKTEGGAKPDAAAPKADGDAGKKDSDSGKKDGGTAEAKKETAPKAEKPAGKTSSA